MIENRRYLYHKATVDGNTELDYIRTPLPNMSLSLREKFRVTSQYVGRIDLISYKMFNTFNLGWLILEYNDILDPYDEIVVGTVLNIPNIDEYYSFFNQNSIT